MGESQYDIVAMMAGAQEILSSFLAGQTSSEDLQKFAWSQMEKWESVFDQDLPELTENDRVYWDTIYTMLIAGDDPPEFHPSREDFELLLRCLRGTEKLPEDHVAKRPSHRRDSA